MSLTYGAIFLGLCLAAHVFLRVALPYADPYLFPLVAVLAGFGLVMIYRIDDTLARQQAQWFVVGLVLFVATIVFLRDYRELEQYRYMIAASSIAAPARCRGIGARSTAPTSRPASGRSSSSRRSSRRSGSSSSSPPTCATRGRCSCRARGACWA